MDAFGLHRWSGTVTLNLGPRGGWDYRYANNGESLGNPVGNFYVVPYPNRADVISVPTCGIYLGWDPSRSKAVFEITDDGTNQGTVTVKTSGANSQFLQITPRDSQTGSCWINNGATGVTLGGVIGTARVTGSTSSSISSWSFFNYLQAKTADYTTVLTESAGTFTNTGASGEVIFTLPTSPTTGWRAQFIVTAAQFLRIKTSSTNKIRYNGNASAAAGFIRSNTVDSVIMVEYVATDTYQVTNILGTWNAFDT